MTDVVRLLSPGGVEFYFTLPLPYGIQCQLDAGALHPAEELTESEEDLHLNVEDAASILLPKRNAGKPEWLRFAVSQGMDEDKAASMTRNELAASFVRDDDLWEP